MRLHMRRTSGATAGRSAGGRTRDTEHRMFPWIKCLTAVAVVAAAAAALTLGSTSGTLALWNESEDIPAATIKVGGMDIAISAGTQSAPQGQASVAIPATTWSTMLPGDVVGTPLTITNRGASPVRISASLDQGTAGNGLVAISLNRGSCPADALAETALTASTSAPIGPAIAIAESAPHCLSVKLSEAVPAASQGTQIVSAFNLSITGTPERSS